MPNINSKNNKDIKYPNNKNFKGNKNNIPNNQNNSKVRNLQIIMEILPRTLNTRSLSVVGSVMAHTMLQSVQTGRRLVTTFIPYKRR